MAKGLTRCNVCGQPFTDLDEQEHIGLHTKIGYGSRHDGDTIDLDILKLKKDVLKIGQRLINSGQNQLMQ